MIAGKNEDVARLLTANRIDVLVDGVCRALIPVLRDAHLWRQHFNEFAVSQEGSPAAAYVTIEAQRIVLPQHKDAPQVAIQAVGKRDVDNSVDAAKRH